MYKKLELKPQMEGLDINVYEASKYRIKRMINNNDVVCVTFTAGKDSTVVLYLVEECMRELGRKDKVKVIFRDEEFVPNETLNFVQELINTGKYEWYYYCLPTKIPVQCMGVEDEYILWNPIREHKRNPPEYAITLDDVGNILLKDPMNDAIKLFLKEVVGRVVIFNGHRSQESFNVFRSLVNNPIDCYFHKSNISQRCTLCKPIYDWRLEDVFLYFLKNDLPYNPIYNYFMWLNLPLRSDIPLGKNASRDLSKYRVYDPDYYNLIMEAFPDLDSSARYSKDISIKQIIKRYGGGFKGVLCFVDDEYSGESKKRLLVELREIYHRKKKKTTKDNPLGCYPILRVYKHILYKTYLDKDVLNYTLDDFLYEGLTKEDYIKWKGNHK